MGGIRRCRSRARSSDTDKTLDRGSSSSSSSSPVGHRRRGRARPALSRAALAPVRRLTQTAEEVSETRDLSRRIDVYRPRRALAARATFNTMLAALEEAARAQRQLVSDASHELRTPLTSLRTNIEVLTKENVPTAGARAAAARRRGAARSRCHALVAELVELARGDEKVRRSPRTCGSTSSRPRRSSARGATGPASRSTPGSTSRSCAACRRRSSARSRTCSTTPRSGARRGAQVDVEVHDGELAVRDHGPGIAAEDVPFVFDRFYRAPSARSMPGSGLGLAIVRQVADTHGGSIVSKLPKAVVPGCVSGCLLRTGRTLTRLTNQSARVFPIDKSIGFAASCARA